METWKHTRIDRVHTKTGHSSHYWMAFENEEDHSLLVSLVTDLLKNGSVYEVDEQLLDEKEVLCFLPGVFDEESALLQEQLACYAKGKLFITSGYSHPATENPLLYERMKVSDIPKALLKKEQSHLFIKKEFQLFSPSLDYEEWNKKQKKMGIHFSPEEWMAIQKHFLRNEVQEKRKEMGLPSQMTDVEVEVIAQTWSEHCSHKIFKACIDYEDDDESCTVEKGIFKEHIQVPTQDLIQEGVVPYLRSVFTDNSGIVSYDGKKAYCLKVETHNGPTVLDPYGGCLTGVLGVQRDIAGTGKGATCLANMYALCLGTLGKENSEWILKGVQKGIEDGGNQMGIPTVNGSLFFSDDSLKRPYVYVGTLGECEDSKELLHNHISVGDRIVMVGGGIGRDGIHGATLSSASFNEETPASMVQLGDAFMQRRLFDFLDEVREERLISGITDNGAGGLSSSVGEMAQEAGGACLILDNLPLKMGPLKAFEAVISESQERMTLAVSAENVPRVKMLAQKYRINATDCGFFDGSGNLTVLFHNECCAQLDLSWLFDGIPQMKFKVRYQNDNYKNEKVKCQLSKSFLLTLLSHENFVSKKTFFNRFDRVVGGRVEECTSENFEHTPLSYIKNDLESSYTQGVALAQYLAPWVSEDSAVMTDRVLDTVVRKMICAGASLNHLAMLDNFCWPDPLPADENPLWERKLASLVRSTLRIKNFITETKVPFISGKDSMKNSSLLEGKRFDAPECLLVTGISSVEEKMWPKEKELKEGCRIFLMTTSDLSWNTSLVRKSFQLGKVESEKYPSKIQWKSQWKSYVDLSHKVKNSCFDLMTPIVEGGIFRALVRVGLTEKIGIKISLPSEELSFLFGESAGSFLVFSSSKNPLQVDGFNLYEFGEVRAIDELQIVKKDGECLRLTSLEMKDAYYGGEKSQIFDS